MYVALDLFLPFECWNYVSVSKLYAALVINIQKEKKKSVLFGKCHISKKTCFVRFAIYCLLILKVLRVCRDVHNRELEAFRSFINTIYSTPVRGIGEDKRCWLSCKSKGFMVAYYHLLVGQSEQFFPWKSIWKQKIPSRVAFFVWTAVLGKCLTIDNLRKRKVCILDWCYMCKCNCETVDHLFLHYLVALELWDMVFGLFGVYWVMPMSVVGLFACWQGQFGPHCNGDIWMVVPHCLM